MQDFKKTFQTLPTNFISLSTETSEPFVIPNVSPVSPNSTPINSPIMATEDDEAIKIGKERSISIIGLN